MSPKIHINRNKIETFCKKWKIVELSLFGSVLWDDFRDDSDVDVLVRFAEDARWTFSDYMNAEEEFAGIIGREVDLVERKVIENDENWLKK